MSGNCLNEEKHNRASHCFAKTPPFKGKDCFKNGPREVDSGVAASVHPIGESLPADIRVRRVKVV